MGGYPSVLVGSVSVCHFKINVSANAVASQLVRNGRYEAVDCKWSPVVSQVSHLWRATTLNPVNISDTFSQREFTIALQHLKPGKALSPDSICPELIIHAGAAFKSWLHNFLSYYQWFVICGLSYVVPAIVALTQNFQGLEKSTCSYNPKMKPVWDPKNHGLISLLCVPYKIIKRLIYARVKPIIDPLLPKEQAGF